MTNNKRVLVRVYYCSGLNKLLLSNYSSSQNSSVDFFVEKLGWHKADIYVDAIVLSGEPGKDNSSILCADSIVLDIEGINKEELLRKSQFIENALKENKQMLFDGVFNNDTLIIKEYDLFRISRFINILQRNCGEQIIYVAFIDENRIVKSVRGTFSIKQFRKLLYGGKIPLNSVIIISKYERAL